MMKPSHLAGLAALLACAGFAGAQPPSLPVGDPDPATPLFGGQPAATPFDATGAPACSADAPACSVDAPCHTHVWASADYLLWWMKNGPLPAPLVTTNPNAFGSIGALNDPGTRVLFGGNSHDLDYNPFSGGRVTVGGCFNEQGTIGGELSGFLFATQDVGFLAASPGGAAPIVSIPFNATVPFNLNPAGETSLNAGNTPNAVGVSSSSRLWGAEANGLLLLFAKPRTSLTLLGGFRYLDLDERLGLNDTFNDAATGGSLSVTDGFHTHNQFYGGQLGLRSLTYFGRLSVAATAKCALGVDDELSEISGNTGVTKGAFGFPTGVVPGGVFAEPSNIGRHTDTPFTVVPEAQFQVGYDLTHRIRATVGYDFLYVNDVLRPGAQIDRNINPTQSVLFGGTGGVLNGPGAPSGATSHSDFWTQGINLGLQFRF